ncbi:MAG: hypothetical protein Q8891_04335 [Bacteroidota bacterium]|nr:hypothetical protein [Bacteroidota bacterium]
MYELAGSDYRSFLNYFSINYPELRNKFPKEFVWRLGPPFHGMEKPVDMSDFDFNSFREIEFRWLIREGFIQVPKDHVSFILPTGGVAFFEPHEILRLEKVDSNTTKVYLSENGFEHSLNIFGDIASLQEILNSSK